MALAEYAEVGFEEGMSWLPSQVLDEAFSDTTNNINNKVIKVSCIMSCENLFWLNSLKMFFFFFPFVLQTHMKKQLHHQHHYRPKLPAETLPQVFYSFFLSYCDSFSANNIPIYLS